MCRALALRLPALSSSRGFTCAWDDLVLLGFQHLGCSLVQCHVPLDPQSTVKLSMHINNFACKVY